MTDYARRAAEEIGNFAVDKLDDFDAAATQVIAAAIARATADLTRERDEALAACAQVEFGLQWTGDGFEWNPALGDYRESPGDAIARGSRLMLAELDDTRAELAALKWKMIVWTDRAKEEAVANQCFDLAARLVEFKARLLDDTEGQE